MKEALHLEGNDLNYLNVAYYTAYVVGQIPMLMIQTVSFAPTILQSRRHQLMEIILFNDYRDLHCKLSLTSSHCPGWYFAFD